jgi:hypothetical protein
MIAKLLPPRVRQAAYVILSTLAALELVWDVIPAGWESKLMASFTVLGFGVAASQVKAKD